MSTSIVVVGAGGFGREVLDVIEALNLASATAPFALQGVVDDAPSERNLQLLSLRGVPWLGTVGDWLSSGSDAAYVIGVGDPATREKIAVRLTAAHRVTATLIHPSASIGSVSSIGRGTVLCAGVDVSTNVTIGDHVHVNPSATIGHDSVLADFVSVNPGAIVSGDVNVGRTTLVGAGAVVLQGLLVGRGATVGAAACVTKDVPPDTVVRGVPAR